MTVAVFGKNKRVLRLPHMFDIANPQKRERLLIIFACIVLGFIVINMIPAQFREINRLRQVGNKLRQDIADRQQLARDKEQIESRLAAMEQRALASLSHSSGSQAESRYRAWLDELARDSGLTASIPNPPTSTPGVRGPRGYTRHTFTITGEGQLGPIAEFLRRFQRTEYLHTIRSVRISPAVRSGVFPVTITIEALSLPQVELVNMPDTEDIAATSEERRLMMAIRSRGILSEYAPQAPLTRVSRTSDSITFTWLAIDDTDVHDIRYKLRAAQNREENWTIIEAATGTIDGLLPSTQYEFQIRAVYDDGPAEWSASVFDATTVPEPPPIPDAVFEDFQFCFLTSVVESDGIPQAWINHRTEGVVHKLYEGESFVLGGVQCTIRHIDVDNQRVLIDIAGLLASIRVSQHFDQIADHAFFTAIVEVDGRVQVRIDNQTEGDIHELFEGESLTFVLGNRHCTIHAIDLDNQRMWGEIVDRDDNGNLIRRGYFLLNVGQHFDQAEVVWLE